MGTEKAVYGLFKTNKQKNQYNPTLPIVNELTASSPFSYKFHYMFEVYNVIKNIDSKKGSLLMAKFPCPNQTWYCTAIISALRRWQQDNFEFQASLVYTGKSSQNTTHHVVITLLQNHLVFAKRTAKRMAKHVDSSLYNPSTQEVEAGGPRVQGQRWLQRRCVCQCDT